MAKPFLLSISLCLLLFNACLARRPQQSQFNECQLNSLNALEPDHRIESEAGLTESWNANHPELRCAGVAVIKRTIQPRGLHLPSYSNSPQLHFIIHGRGVLGTAIPGCAETFEKPQSQSRQGGRSQQDRHQKVRHFREGDIIAIPAGIPYWTYNNGDSPLVAITLLDTTNLENQLDRNPRRFYLAGNPEEEHPESQKGRQQQGGNNVLSGFDPQMLAEAFKIDEETARKLQSQEDQRNQIVKVREGLSIISPHLQREEEEEQGRQTQQRHQREQGRHQRGQEEEEEEEEQDPKSRERHQREKGRREGQRRQRQEEEEQQEQERQRRRERGERSRKGRQQEEEEQEEEEEHQQGRQQRERGKGRREEREQEEEEEEEGEGEEQETQARERHQREKGRREGQRRQRQEEEEEEEQREQERQRRREKAEGSRKGRRRQEEEEEEEEEKEQQGRQQRERGKGRRRGRGKEEEQGQGRQGEEEEEEQEQQSWRQGQKGQSRCQGQRGQSEEEEEEGEKEQQRERGCRPQRQRQTRCEQRCEAQRGQGSEDALEETLCSLKLHQNIGNPSHADLYNPRAGRISTINSLDLPILRLLQLSAERVVLYRNGIYAPHWNINANSIIYVTRGRGQVQVVNCQGNSVFNGELRMGQLLVVPQNFPVAKQAGSEGFEYIAFKTNDRAMISSLVGRTSVIRAIPAEVLANAFGIRQQQVSAIKYSRNEGVLVSPASQSQESYIV